MKRTPEQAAVSRSSRQKSGPRGSPMQPRRRAPRLLQSEAEGTGPGEPAGLPEAAARPSPAVPSLTPPPPAPPRPGLAAGSRSTIGWGPGGGSVAPPRAARAPQALSAVPRHLDSWHPPGHSRLRPASGSCEPGAGPALSPYGPGKAQAIRGRGGGGGAGTCLHLPWEPRTAWWWGARGS